MAVTPGWQKKGLVQTLAPGRKLALLPKWHGAPLRAKVLSSLVLGRHQGDLVLSPPHPSLPQPVLGRPMEVTFLSRDRSGLRRYGYYSMVLDTLEDFTCQQGARLGVVVLFPRQQDIFPISLRQTRRFPVVPGGPLGLQVKGLTEVRLLDISIQGLRFSHRPGKGGPRRLDEVALTLLINEEAHGLDGKIVGLKQRKNITELSVEMGALPLNARAALIQALREMEADEPEREEGA